MTTRWTIEEVMAYVDGALSPAEATRIAEIIALDPEARAIADQLRAGSGAARHAFDDALNAPLPLAMVRTLKAEQGPSAAPRPSFSRLLLPLAAGLLLVLGYGAGMLTATGTSSYVLAGGPQGGPGRAEAALVGALETIADGQEMSLGDGSTLVVAGPAQNGVGLHCRAFRRTGTTASRGIACRGADSAWDVMEIPQQ